METIKGNHIKNKVSIDVNRGFLRYRQYANVPQNVLLFDEIRLFKARVYRGSGAEFKLITGVFHFRAGTGHPAKGPETKAGNDKKDGIFENRT